MAVVKPAYGRQYRNKEDARLDWDDGKDFILCDISSIYYGKYCSIRDFPKESSVELRYDDNRKLVMVKGSK